MAGGSLRAVVGWWGTEYAATTRSRTRAAQTMWSEPPRAGIRAAAAAGELRDLTS